MGVSTQGQAVLGSVPRGERIPFRIHPRVFAALGADLVTNDIVAIIELVKNSYDAFATTVDIRFGSDVAERQYLEIFDDGTGMDRRTLEEAWCVVATPYRRHNPVAAKDKKVRRASGEKGLGRLSAARLGHKLEMLTRAVNDRCWLVEVDWTGLSEKDDLDACFARCSAFTAPSPFAKTGTRIRIFDLASVWDAEHVADLEDNLARLISPFSKIEDFTIRLTAQQVGEENAPVEITSPDFLNHPPYAIRGHVASNGAVNAHYEFRPIKGRPRDSAIRLNWGDIKEGSEIADKLNPASNPSCGPFEFEIRAWDIGANDTGEIAEHFDIAKGNVRKAIRVHKGISLYRDGILALPKSDDGRDWLGLDLRRISRVGTRLSTSQIVGYVSISADKNGEILDKSDREGLVQNPSVLAFEEIIKGVVAQLENQRDADRLKPGHEIKLQALLEDVSADDLVEEFTSLADDGAVDRHILQSVLDFNAKLQLVRQNIQTRLVYYSRLAAIGTIAQMLIHEIRNRTTAIGRFLRTARMGKQEEFSREFGSQLQLAESAVAALEKLADTFSPLANRSFKRGRRVAVIEESIARCVSLSEGEIKRAGIKVVPPTSTETTAAVDPGELDAVLLNLVSNAIYWITKSNRSPILEFTVRRRRSNARIAITVSDSGTGVPKEDIDKIFLPGVTRRPGGIGMGLTIAAELVSEYGGKLSLVQPGKLGGASFTFDVPPKTA
jgi:signal transduction histidine kinase